MLAFQAARFCLVAVDSVHPTGWAHTERTSATGRPPLGVVLAGQGPRGSDTLLCPKRASS